MISANERFFMHFNSHVRPEYIRIIISNVINQKDVDKFCFVEGNTDEAFYSSTSHEFFSKNKIKFLYVGYNVIAEYKGKKAVVLATKVVEKNYNKLKDKFVFIVDHDDFGLEEYIGSVDEQYLNMITTLPVYSFENYYFYADNLGKSLCDHVEAHQLEEFKKDLDIFCEEIIDYFSLKAVKTASHSLKGYSKLKDLYIYKFKYEDKDIFNFQFRDEDHYNREAMKYEVSKLGKIISGYPKAAKLYNKIRTEMASSKDFIKGKILFQYMKAYLKHHYNMNINDRKVITLINRQLEMIKSV